MNQKAKKHMKVFTCPAFSFFQMKIDLEKENQMLRMRIDLQTEQTNTLRSHIGLICQHMVTFILDQMDTPYLQSDSEV